VKRLTFGMRRAASLAAAGFALQLAGCAELSNLLTPQAGAAKPASLVEFKPGAALRALWQASAGAAANYSLQPAMVEGGVVVVDAAGHVIALDTQTGKQLWNVDAGSKISGGVGSGEELLLLGTPKGYVLAYDSKGRFLWRTEVSSEVLAAPQRAGAVVVVRTGDGRIFGLDAADGKRKWVYQRPLPALSLRSDAGVLINGSTVYAGFAGGKLVALNLVNGNLVWEATVSQPRGSTELERIADITSSPILTGRAVCAVAYQGRVACFDSKNGNPLWTKELSSTTGLAVDEQNIYVTDERGAVIALAKDSGTLVWKQDKLAGRKVSAPLVHGNNLVVGDFEGYVHVLAIGDGAFVARLATDGSPIRVRPTALEKNFAVQTANGGLYALTIQ